jgi:hypothetical protein
MSGRQVAIELDPSLFGEREKLVARSGAFVATAFTYRSGVAGLRIENGAGTVTLLPFQGQQIWDAVFFGRSLTMRSMFDEPVPTREYLRTYGALFLHCGGTSMGNPGPTDTHPLHGDLPNLPHTDARLVFGEDQNGAYVDLTGSATDKIAFGHNFVSRPRVRMREGATQLDVSVDVQNLGGKPLPFLYLAHINFRPIDGATLIDTVRDDRTDAVIRQPKLAADEDPAIAAYHRAIAADPSSHRSVKAGVPVQPELVLTMTAAVGSDGWTHALQKHPDASGDFVSWRPDDLPYAVRWMTRGPDKDALGLVLPATAAPDGLAAATANRQIVWVEPGEAWRSSFRFGAVDAASAAALEDTIKTIRGS